MSEIGMLSTPSSSKPNGSAAGDDPTSEDGAARLRKYDLLGIEASSRAKSPEAKQWFDFVSESRLRIDNLRTMAHLNMMSSSDRFTPKFRKVEQSGISSLDVPSGSQLPDELMMLLDQLKLKGFDVRAHDELPRNRTDPIQCLTDDILIQIFSHLSYPEIIAAQRVSKSWLYYLVSEPYLHRNVSFVASKHHITLRTLRTVLAMADGRVISLEFSAGTLMHLTPLVLMYPHLQRLVIEHNSNIMSTIFNIAFQVSFDSYHKLPNLRTAVITHGVLLKNELITLISIAPNLEEFQCRKAVVTLDSDALENALENCRMKRLRIYAYSERRKTQPIRWLSTSRQTNMHARHSPMILQFMPLLEELVLGIECMQILDLSANRRIRHVDFTVHSHVVSFVQPPPSLEVCLNAPHLNATILPSEMPKEELNANIDRPSGVLQPWTNPPQFKTVSLISVPLRPNIFSRAMCNSYLSLTALSIDIDKSNPKTDYPGLPVPDNYDSWAIERRFIDFLAEHLVLFQSLRHLGVRSDFVMRCFLSRVAMLKSLEYFSVSSKLVDAAAVLQFLESSQCCSLREINVHGSLAAEELCHNAQGDKTIAIKVGLVAESRHVKLETQDPEKILPAAIYEMY